MGWRLQHTADPQPVREQGRPFGQRRILLPEAGAVRPVFEHVQFGWHASVPGGSGSSSLTFKRRRAVVLRSEP